MTDLDPAKLAGSEDRRQIALLHTAPGLKGSGRLRYGAAMHLHARGLLPDQALELYRIVSPHDGDDPSALLAENGLLDSVPPVGIVTATDRISILLAEADAYLAGLQATGINAVRRRLARWRNGSVVPATACTNKVVARYLPAALDQVALRHPALASAIAAGAPHLSWITYDGYKRQEIGPDFLAGHAYSSLIGENACIAATDFDFGIFLIAPHVLYRDHMHRAPELYAPLTGPHGWRFGPGSKLKIKQADVPIWNPSYAPHLTKAGPVPFLCFFGWTKNVGEAATVIAADDWQMLEALRLID